MDTEVTTGEEVAVDAGQETTGIEVVAADVQQGAAPDAGETQEVESDEVHGLKAAAAAERQKRQALEAQVSALTQAQVQQQVQQPAQRSPQEDASMYAQAAQHLGLGYGEDVYHTSVEQAQIHALVRQHDMKQAQDQQFIAATPDYADVIGQKNQFGQMVYAQPLINFLSRNPNLQQQVANNPQLAYQLASSDPEYIAQKNAALTAKQTAAATAVVQKTVNKGKVSISAAPGGGAIDKMSQMRDMSNDELTAKIADLKSRA